MTERQLGLNLALIFSETCFQALLYVCVLGLMKESLPINPLLFFVLTATLTTVNYFLSFKSIRFLTIGLINLIITGLLVGLMIWLTGLPLVYLFVLPSGLLPRIKVALIDCIILWLVFRSILLVYRRKPINVYGHFDLYIFLTLGVFLAIGIAEIPLPGRMIWILTALFFNLLPLYIHNNAGTYNPLTVWFCGGLAVIFLYFASQNITILANVSEPAGTVFDFLQSAFLVFVHSVAQIIGFLAKLLYGKRGVSTADNHASAESEVVTGTDVPDLPWLYVAIKILLGICLLIVALIIIFALYTLVRYAIFTLLRKRKGQERTIPSFDPFQPWKTVFGRLREFVQQISCLLLPFLPFKMSVQQAYNLLLRWGHYKRCARGIGETPYNYYRRLAVKYPQLKEQLQIITEAFIYYRYAPEKEAPADNPSLKKTVRRVYLEDLYRFLRR
ncbi:MAG: DUF4129 domain-containing protein [Peptococcaceae bacterium]|nr:DUF4129 domain-containing protein [Peptococcaceae bacterium]